MTIRTAITCNRVMMVRLLFLIASITAGVGAVVSCSSAVRHHAHMPTNAITIDGDDYEVITCRGVNQSRQPCPSGDARRFKGALVCKLEGKWSERVPAALCLHLPYGCAPYEPPQSDKNTKELPSEYVVGLKASFPHVDACAPRGLAFIREGSVPVSNREVIAFNRAVSQSIPEKFRRYVQSGGIGRCCRPGAVSTCVSLDMYEGLELSPSELMRVIETARVATVNEDSSVELDVVWHPRAGPRCDAIDPECGPQLFGGGCLSEIQYDPRAPRKPLMYDYPEQGHQCIHDGDCFGGHDDCLECYSRLDGNTVAHAVCTTPRGRQWDRAMCGCYNGWCLYFTQ